MAKSPRSKKSPVRALADYARKVTCNGESIVDFLLDVMTGDCPGSTPRDMIEAAKLLKEFGFGKAPLAIEVTGQFNHVLAVPGFDPRKYSDAELAVMQSMLERGQVAGELGDGVEAAPEMEDAEVAPTEPAVPVVRDDRPWRRRAQYVHDVDDHDPD